MNNIIKFANEKFGEIRTVVINDALWFSGKDVASALGYSDTSDAIKSHVDPEDKLSRQFADSGQRREMYIINESGLYSLILSSKLESAKEFKRWVTAEVLPSLRKTGGYIVGQDEMTEEEFLKKALEIATRRAEESRKRVKQLEAENAVQKQVIEDFIPVKQYVDTILESKDSVTVTQIAADYGISAKQLNRILKEEHIQYKVNGQWILYRKYQGKGYTDSKTYLFKRTTSEQGTSMLTRWTQSGRLMIHEILKHRGIIPVMDREQARIDSSCSENPNNSGQWRF